MKTDGSNTKQFQQDSGKQMLAGVLLHVIEAPGPIDGTSNFTAALDRLLDHMGDAIFFIDHLDDRSAPQRSPIEWLAARGWIKRGAIEIHARALRASVDDVGPELGQIAVVVVEAVRH